MKIKWLSSIMRTAKIVLSFLTLVKWNCGFFKPPALQKEIGSLISDKWVLAKKSIKSESCNTTRKSFKKGQLLLIKNNLSRDCVVMHMFMYYKLVTVLQHGFIVVNNFPKEWPLSVFQQNSIMVYFYEGMTKLSSAASPPRKREKSNSR